MAKNGTNSFFSSGLEHVAVCTKASKAASFLSTFYVMKLQNTNVRMTTFLTPIPLALRSEQC